MERVKQSQHFKVTGFDYIGALYVRWPVDGINKVCIALFTFAVTRAIHLEIVEDCSETEFLMVIRMFVSRRLIPSLMIIDNAGTLKAASKTLKSIFEHDSIRRFCEDRGINWKFIIKGAPWTGGFYKTPQVGFR